MASRKKTRYADTLLNFYLLLGQGKFSLKDGTIYEGSFINGEIEGVGAKKWPDGKIYEGEIYHIVY